VLPPYPESRALSSEMRPLRRVLLVVVLLRLLLMLLREEAIGGERGEVGKSGEGTSSYAELGDVCSLGWVWRRRQLVVCG
jgi:hypothetical protein